MYDSSAGKRDLGAGLLYCWPLIGQASAKRHPTTTRHHHEAHLWHQPDQKQ